MSNYSISFFIIALVLIVGQLKGVYDRAAKAESVHAVFEAIFVGLLSCLALLSWLDQPAHQTVITGSFIAITVVFFLIALSSLLSE